ncbi:dinitrogenase iron-molybdenum cofactor biosynthesis protein [Marinobacterium litorale]|uniref:dinitrogenase iron-molybdenum cofactor biosynthesis protein n=1 Tax=Marinobacterium litorale TaxID=404770 RepID=UPI0003F6DC10|nr:dinitrogenase iron-molybdenum cofactor biosynthesis protein [Marinobacterium litorale]
MEALDRELALRIALAARVLPGVEVGELLDILHERVGTPLDDEALKRVTVTNLKTGIGSLDGEEDGEDIGIGLENIKLAVRYLWGEESDEDLPQIEAYRDGDLPGSVRVAVASNAGNLLNGHFGSCLRYLIYQLSPTDMRLVDIRSAIEADDSDDRNLFRVDLIRDCQVLFVQTMGGPAAARVIRADIYPIKVPDVIDASEKLKEFQQVFKAPPPWFSKILGLSAEERKRFRSEEQVVEE